MGLQFFLVLFLSLVVFGLVPVFATNPTDSSPWQTSKNYAATPVKVLDCTPYGGDSDGDGICNNWEDGTFGPGLHIDFTDNSLGTTSVHYKYDLSCTPGNTITNDPTGLTVCPSPTKKDIYLEIDWMTGHDISSTAIADVVKAFDKMGIALHIQYGENPSTNSGDIGVHYCDVRRVLSNGGTAGQACSITTTNYQSYPFLKQNFFGTTSERSGNITICPRSDIPTSAGTVSNANSYNCLTAKRQVFHYGLVANYQWGSATSSGWSELVGNDFLISLGNFANGVGGIDEQEGSSMHELGHNLGLNHGGVQDSTNCKPNYLGVMNYVYQFRENTDVCRPLAYSNTALANLNENSLTDSNIGSYPYPSDNPPPPPGTKTNQPTTCPTSGERNIWWSYPSGVYSGTTGVKNDWDGNGIDSNTYSQNLNNLGGTCTDSTFSTLTGFNDTDFILHGNTANPQPLNFRTSSNFYQGLLPSAIDSPELGQGDNHEEVTTETVLQLANIVASSHPSSIVQHPDHNDLTFLLYVIIGLIIAVLAIVIVILVLSRTK